MTPADASARLSAQLMEMGARARSAARILARTPAAQKTDGLLRAADHISACAARIVDINAADIAAAEATGASAAFIDRMTLTPDRLAGAVAAIRDIANRDDPVGKSIARWVRPNGLEIERMRTPIGVIAIIYESRPNVTVDAAAICVKSGNAVILRGGSECIATSAALHACFVHGLNDAGLPADAAQFVAQADRTAVGAILGGLGGAVDLIVPRGGKSLVARVAADARAPVLAHLEGLCHVYVDADADLAKAVAIVVNSKMRRTGVCGAAETLLIDRRALATLWPPIAEALRAKGCELRGDAAIAAIDPGVAAASEEDWRTEYLDAILSVAAVDGMGGAVAHIARYGSGHTDAIVTENAATAEEFLASVDSAIVLHNASTQFADGGEFGLGGEIGIATGKLHARGPVGVDELTTYKNVVRGVGQTRP